MRTYSVALAIALLAALSGCGKGANEPVANEPSSGAVERWGQQASQTVERHKQQIKHDLDDVAAEADAAVRRTQQRVTNGLHDKKNDLSEYAAEMAEDAKDRALEIPDALDEFFGTPGEFRRQSSRGKKGKTR